MFVSVWVRVACVCGAGACIVMTGIRGRYEGRGGGVTSPLTRCSVSVPSASRTTLLVVDPGFTLMPAWMWGVDVRSHKQSEVRS